jgi:autonomous glycyl radical cofactor GrcA
MNSRKEDREILRKNGFAENEVILLSKLRIDYNEKEVRQALADRRRLEFYQWMVETGKISDQIA